MYLYYSTSTFITLPLRTSISPISVSLISGITGNEINDNIKKAMDAMDEDMLVRIMKEPKNAILKQYKKLLALDEVDLEFDEGAIEAIAEKALEKKTGARALRAVLEEYMLDIMYEIPKDDNIGKVTITRSYIEKTGGPLIEMRGCDAIPMHH